MKKQLTIFAAAAMLVSFAGAAFAATPVFEMSGKFDYTVEYNALSSNPWANPADEKLVYDKGGNNAVLKASVATTGAPNIGTVTFELVKNAKNDTGIDPSVTLTGSVFGGTLKLGSTNVHWDHMINPQQGHGWWGPVGADYTKTIGNADVDLFTGSWGVTEVANGLRVGANLKNGKLYAATMVNPENAGVVSVGGETTFGTLAVVGRYAKEIGAGSDATAVFAKASLPVSPTFKLTAYAVSAPATYNRYKPENDWEGRDAFAWWVKKGEYNVNDKFSVYAKADITLKQDVSNAYVEFESRANNTSWGKVGANYKPMFVEDASVKVDNTNVATVEAKFKKDLGNATFVKAGVAAQTTTSGSTVTTGGAITFHKTFDGWLNTWAGVSKNYNTVMYPTWDNWDYGFSAGKPLAVKMGANATVSF